MISRFPPGVISYLFLTSFLLAPSDQEQLLQSLPDLPAALAPNTRILTLLPHRLYAEKSAAKIYNDKLGQFLKWIDQVTRSHRVHHKVLLLNHPYPSPHLSPIVSLANTLLFHPHNSNITPTPNLKLKPVFLPDLLSFVPKLLFTRGLPYQVTTLNGPTEVSLLNLTLKYQQLGLSSKTSTSTSDEYPMPLPPTSHHQSLISVTHLDIGLKQTLDVFKPTTSSTPTHAPAPTQKSKIISPPPTITLPPTLAKRSNPPPPTPPNSLPRTSLRSKFSFSRLVYRLALIIFLLTLLISSPLILTRFLVQDSLQQKPLTAPQFNSRINTLHTVFHTTSPIYAYLNQSSFPSPIRNLFTHLPKWYYAGLVNYKFRQSQDFFSSAFTRILDPSSPSAENTLQSAQNQTNLLHTYTSLFIHQLSEQDTSNSLLITSTSPQDLYHTSGTVIKAIDALKKLIIRPDKTTILILLQNNQELRPTGGFISGIAFLDFEQGKLTNVDIKDSYALDDQLNGKVAPPVDLVTSLGETSWYLRDSNWNPVFLSSARQISWFIDKEVGRSVDAVVGINLNTFQSILKKLGELNFTDGRRITAANIFEQAFYHQDNSLEAEEGTVSDFLLELFTTLYDQLLANPSLITPIFSGLLEAAQAGELTLAAFAPDIQFDFQSLGWAGELVQSTCLDSDISGCDSVYSHLFEANVGINKSNHFITRQRQIDLILNDKQLKYTDTLRLTNTATTNAWPSGDYKNYIRYYLPQNSYNVRVNLNDQALPSQSLRRFSQADFKVVGVLVTTPPGESTLLRLSFDTNFITLEDSTQIYVPLVKQPGVNSYPVTLTFDNQSSWQVNSTSANVPLSNPISIESISLTDPSVSVELHR